MAGLARMHGMQAMLPHDGADILFQCAGLVSEVQGYAAKLERAEKAAQLVLPLVTEALNTQNAFGRLCPGGIDLASPPHLCICYIP